MTTVMIFLTHAIQLQDKQDPASAAAVWDIWQVTAKGSIDHFFATSVVEEGTRLKSATRRPSIHLAKKDNIKKKLEIAS